MSKMVIDQAYMDALRKSFYMSPLMPGEKTEENKEPEEWIWVDGYKATKADMTCYDYQYELGKQHDMPEDEDIIECRSGFHLCLRLEDVFSYYKIGKDNRFFQGKSSCS